jgi:hypothetical protein
MSAEKKEHSVDHLEMDEKNFAAADDAPVVSAFATLTRAQCVKKFWRLYMAGLGVSIAGM